MTLHARVISLCSYTHGPKGAGSEQFYASGPPEPVIDPTDQQFSDDPSLKKTREQKRIAKRNRRLENT